MCLIIINIDSREKLKLDFIDDLVTGTEIMTLPVGDYGVTFSNGYQCPLVFERKNLTDLFGTLGSGYKRFKKEIEKSKDFGFKLIILIEGSMSKIYEGIEHSQRGGESVVMQLNTIWIKYDIPYYCFCGSNLTARYEMSRFIIETYSAVGRQAIENLKRGEKK